MSSVYNNPILYCALSAAAGMVATELYEAPRKAAVANLIAEQKKTILRLTAEKTECLQRQPDRQTPSADQQKPVPVTSLDKLLRDCHYSLSVACQFGYDPVEVAKRHRNDCSTSAKLNIYLDKMDYICEQAEKAASDVEKSSINRARNHYQELRNNYRISPPQCVQKDTAR
jgi:hypothetical protein